MPTITSATSMCNVTIQGRRFVDTTTEGPGRHQMGWMGEVQVAATPTGQAGDGRRQGTLFGLQCGQGGIAAVAGVDVDDNNGRDPPGDDSDVGLRPAIPPELDVGRGGPPTHPPLPQDPGVLADRGAAGPAAAAAPAVGPMHGDDGPAPSGQGQSGVTPSR